VKASLKVIIVVHPLRCLIQFSPKKPSMPHHVLWNFFPS